LATEKEINEFVLNNILYTHNYTQTLSSYTRKFNYTHISYKVTINVVLTMGCTEQSTTTMFSFYKFHEVGKN